MYPDLLERLEQELAADDADARSSTREFSGVAIAKA
jgi:hypothetical protein